MGEKKTDGLVNCVTAGINRLENEITLLSIEPNAGYLSDLIGNIFDELHGQVLELKLPEALEVLGNRPAGYSCVPRDMGITLYQAFISRLKKLREHLAAWPSRRGGVGELPAIKMGVSHAEVRFDCKEYDNVDLRAAEALKAICDVHPLPCGLTTAIGEHPERAIKKLPSLLQKRCQSVSGNKGYIFKLGSC